MASSTEFLTEEKEVRRLRALSRYDWFERVPEEGFSRIIQLASSIFSVPVVLISLVGRDTQFFMARVGTDLCEVDRQASFCTHAIEQDEPLIILDTLADPFHCNNAFVVNPPNIRFYAGAPLRSQDGCNIGTICLLDVHPREAFTEDQREMLRSLASLVMDRMDLQRAEIDASERHNQFLKMTAALPDAVLVVDENGSIALWNQAASAVFGYGENEVLGRPLSLVLPSKENKSFAQLSEKARSENASTGPVATGTMAIRKDGTLFPAEITLSRWLEKGSPRLGVILRDVSERHQAEQRLVRAARFDQLTGLLNRASICQAIADTLASDAGGAVLLLDLDGFKQINDTHGHAAGDLILQAVAQRLTAELRSEDRVGRLGGDEFVVLLNGRRDYLNLIAIGERLITAIERPIDLAQCQGHVSSSIGLSLIDAMTGDTSDAILGDADLALYRAKQDGRGCVRLFSHDLRINAQAKGNASQELQNAWNERAFVLYYQPQVRLSDGVLMGAEALIRWSRPSQGLVLPGAFLFAIEGSHLAVPVGNWVLRTACEQAARWRADGQPTFRMAVNLFAAQLRVPDFAENVRCILDEFNLPPEALELEVTENTLLRGEKKIIEQLVALRDLGVGIALDDFGTGHGSLSLLQELPVSRLKLDRSFVHNIETVPHNQTIVDAVICLSRGFSLDVIAEGVETRSEAAYLSKICNGAQGYLFGRPMSAADFELGLTGRCQVDPAALIGIPR